MTYPPPYEQQPGSQPTQPVPPSSSPPTAPYPAYLGQPAPAPRRRSNGPILAVVIALAVLLVGGAVTAGVLLVNSGDDPRNDVIADPTRGPQTPQAEQTTPETDPSEDDYGSDNSGDGAKVVYEVTGSGSANVIFFKADGITPEQVGEADLPWRKELTLEGDAAFVSVNATRASGDGALGCRITIDGKEVAKKSANGQYAIVLCSKLVL
jgi:hypothetical protein